MSCEHLPYVFHMVSGAIMVGSAILVFVVIPVMLIAVYRMASKDFK